MKLFEKCLICNRPLKNMQSKERGYGDICWIKHNKLESLSKETLLDIEQKSMKSGK